MMGIAFLVASRCNSCSFFYNVCTFAFGEINILLLLLLPIRNNRTFFASYYRSDVISRYWLKSAFFKRGGSF